MYIVDGTYERQIELTQMEIEELREERDNMAKQNEDQAKQIDILTQQFKDQAKKIEELEQRLKAAEAL